MSRDVRGCVLAPGFLLAALCAIASTGREAGDAARIEIAISEALPDSSVSCASGPSDPAAGPGWLSCAGEDDEAFMIDIPEWLEAIVSGDLAGRLTGLDEIRIRIAPARIILGTGFSFSL